MKMEKIKIQQVKKRIGYIPRTHEVVFIEPSIKHCFFNAGDFDFSLDNYTSATRYYNKAGKEIFSSGMAHGKVSYMGSVLVDVVDESAFGPIPGETSQSLVCFDPRIVMIHVLLTWILWKIGDIYEIDLSSYDKFISLKKITDLLHPIPTMEEAKEFLKKNGKYREEPVFDTFTDGLLPPRKLLGVPRKIRDYFKK